MPRYRLTVAYDGTNYFGWQRQDDGKPSIQGELEAAVAPFLEIKAASAPESSAPASGSEPSAPAPRSASSNPLVWGSGRTDAGVHARAQVAHLDLPREIPPLNLLRALNMRLPEDIRVMDAAVVPDDFHAQFQTHGKEYRYFLWNGEVMPPDRRLYATQVRNALDLDAMRDAARRLVGEHDFAAFSANPHRNIRTTVKTVYSIDIVAGGEALPRPTCAPSPRVGTLGPVEIRVRGAGFLYKMVRSIAGILIAVGTGKEKPGAVDEILASKVRTARVESAPAKGLFLWEVWYEGGAGPGTSGPDGAEDEG